MQTVSSKQLFVGLMILVSAAAGTQQASKTIASADPRLNERDNAFLDRQSQTLLAEIA